MIIEYSTNNIEDKDIEIKKSIDSILNARLSSIMCNIHNLKSIKKYIKEEIPVGCFVDHPLSSCAFGRRIDLIKDAIDSGANIIGITIPFYYMINRKYDKLKEDIIRNNEACKKYNVELRYILEYRKFEHALLVKICDILIQNSINVIYPSTGFFVDNLDDNIIACAYLNQKTKIKTIVTGNIWLASHVNSLLKYKPYAISINNISGLEMLFSRLQ